MHIFMRNDAIVALVEMSVHKFRQCLPLCVHRQFALSTYESGVVVKRAPSCNAM